MKALVTGIAGFTGRYLAQALRERGIAVVGLAESPNEVRSVDKVFATDITNAGAVREVVLEVKPTFVVHLAAISFVEHDNVDETYRTNIIGTRNLLEAAAALDVAPRSLLLASSSNIYGNRNPGIMTEGMAPDPVNDYSVSKIAMEYVAALYRTALPIMIVRPFNYTGRGQSEQFIIPKIVEHVRRRAATIELGNLGVARDFSDVRMVADAYARLLVTEAAVGETFNICSGTAVTLRAILDLAERVSGHRMDVHVNTDLVRSNEVLTLHGSPAKVERAIGQLHHIPLEDTLHWMLQG